MANYDVPENPAYSEEIRRIETSDPIHADVVNPMISQLLNNEAYLKNKLDVVANGICKTPQGDTVKEVDCPNFQLRDGARVMVTFHNGSTSNYMNLNVNGTGTFNAWFPLGQKRAYNDEAISKLIAAGCAYEFIFQEDGGNSKWLYCGVVSTAESLGALSKKDLSNNSGGPGIPVIQSAADSGGLMEIGKCIDFHDAGSQADFDARLYCENGNLVSTSPIQASVLGNALSATKAMQDGDGKVIADTYLKKPASGSVDVDNSQILVYKNGTAYSKNLSVYSNIVPINDPVNNIYGITLMDAFNGGYGDTYEDSKYGRIYATGIHLDTCNTSFTSFGEHCSNIRIIGDAPGASYTKGLNIIGDTIDSGDYTIASVGPSCCLNIVGVTSTNSTDVDYFTYINSHGVTSNKFNSSGGDYAEHWEYQDSNPVREDRTGLFVTFAGNKIRIAKKGDNLAKVGVVSAAPSLLGDSDGKEWTRKYQKDVYGRYICEDVQQDDGTVIRHPVLNPAYDENQKYIKRADRPEWDAVGTHGKLVVRDDGTCQPDGFCAPSNGGLATAAEEGFYVMERLDESHVRIYMR